MTETADSAAASAADDEAKDREAARSVTELLEQFGRGLGRLVLREAQLEAARNMPEIRRTARDLVGALVVVLALLTGFVFVNVAAFSGLSAAIPEWLAALLLAAAWIGAGGVLLLGVLGRARRWRMWRVLTAQPADGVDDLEHVRDEAARAVRVTLDQLGPAIAIEMAAAAVPLAGDIATDVAGGVVEMSDDLLEASDDIVEAIADDLPGGSVVNQIWDVVLIPGRFGVRVATTVLRRDPPTS